MKDGEKGKVNASLVISMIALFIAISGAATAAKDSGKEVKLPPNSVGSAQLKPGAVKSVDLARNSVVESKIKPNAVTTESLATDAVTAAVLAPNAVDGSALAPGAVMAGSLAPNAVTATSLAPGSVDANALVAGAVTETKLANGSVGDQKLKDDAVGKEKLKDGAVGQDQIEAGAVVANKIGPRAVTATKIDTSPGAAVTAGSTPMNSSFLSCFLRDDVPFSVVERNVSGVYSLSNPDRLTAPIGGIYRVTGGVSWPAAGGTGRILSVSRNIGSGPNVGQHYTVQGVSTVPASGSSTDQTIAFDVALDQGDYLELNIATCGADVTATKSNFSMNWTGPAS